MSKKYMCTVIYLHKSEVARNVYVDDSSLLEIINTSYVAVLRGGMQLASFDDNGTALWKDIQTET
jgi:hypothetical protein